MLAESSVAERLGTPAEIADAAVVEYRRRKDLLARSSLAAFCTFVLSPLPALALFWGALFAVAGVIVSWLPDEPRDLVREVTPIEVFGAYALVSALLLIPAGILAVLYARLARRTSRRWAWGLAACALVALGAGSANYDFLFSDRPGKSRLTVGIGIGREHLPHLWQTAFPLALGALWLRGSSRSSKSEQNPAAE